MAIQTTLATRYALKTIIMAIVCLVLGVWGIYDYAVAIPRAELFSTRAKLLTDVIQPAMSTELGSTERSKAVLVLNDLEVTESTSKHSWLASLDLFSRALEGGGGEVQRSAQAVLEKELTNYGNVTPPSKFDRPMQWMFILCLPFGFFYIWRYFYMRQKAQTYQLRDDGTLVTPEGEWSVSQIQGIDMSRWIAKTGNARSTWTAKVIVDGREAVVLDDYIYNDMHLIIGAIAHRFSPDEWTPLARRVKTNVIEGVDETPSDSMAEQD